jgi:hypothetical protein
MAATGVTADYLAKVAKMDFRHLEAWLSGASPVPAVIADYYRNADRNIKAEAKRAARRLLEEARAQDATYASILRFPDDRTLSRYRVISGDIPYPLFNVIQDRTAEILEGQGIFVVSVLFEERPYLEWLAKRGKVHSEASLVLWVSERGFEIFFGLARSGETGDGTRPTETRAGP